MGVARARRRWARRRWELAAVMDTVVLQPGWYDLNSVSCSKQWTSGECISVFQARVSTQGWHLHEGGRAAGCKSGQRVPPQPSPGAEAQSRRRSTSILLLRGSVWGHSSNGGGLQVGDRKA